MKLILLMIFAVGVIAWLVWLIGYPVYKKLIKKTSVDLGWYSMWLSAIALFISIINIMIQIIARR